MTKPLTLLIRSKVDSIVQRANDHIIRPDHHQQQPQISTCEAERTRRSQSRMASIDDKTQQLESTVSVAETVAVASGAELIDSIKSTHNGAELAHKKEQELEELKVSAPSWCLEQRFECC